MNRQERWLAAIVMLLFFIVVLLAANLWVALNPSNPMRMMSPMPMMGGGSLSPGASNGERIFKTGTNARGEALSNNMMAGMGGCVMCHGPDGHGGEMMGHAEPCITFGCLSAEGYTEELVKRAVTQGMAEDGHRLDQMMPRWQMSDADLNDLIGHLKTLP